MKVYCAHASTISYKDAFYAPLRNDERFKTIDFVFPHNNQHEGFNTVDVLKKCDFLIADVSAPSTGLGIELGRAERFNVPIIAFHQNKTQPSSAIRFVTSKIFSYNDSDELCDLICKEIMG